MLSPLLWALTPSVKEPLSPASKQWLDEVVVYIITQEEKEYFINLATESERGNFIEQFWQHRDPIPETENNEFKMQYYKRIALANHFFKNEGKPGWRTECGRIFILLGPPSEINRDYSASGQVGGINSGAYETWNYWGLKNPKLPYNIEIRFIDRFGNGQFVLENSLDISQNQTRQIDLANVHASFNKIEFLNETNKLHLFDSAPLKGKVTTSVSYDALPLVHHFTFFKGKKETSKVHMGINVPLNILKNRKVGDENFYSLILSIQAKDNKNQTLVDYHKEINFKHLVGKKNSTAESHQIHAAIEIKPGPIQLEVDVIDLFQGKVGQIKKEVNIPSLNSDHLGMSGIIVGENVDPLAQDPSALESGQKIENDIGQDTNRKIFIMFEVYNLQMDQAEHQSKFKVEFHFHKNKKILNTVVFPDSLSSQSDCRFNTSLKLSQFPSGLCSLDVEITDLISQEKIGKSIDLIF